MSWYTNHEQYFFTQINKSLLAACGIFLLILLNYPLCLFYEDVNIRDSLQKGGV